MERRRRERLPHDAVLLAQMRRRIALARARAPGAPDVPENDALGLRLLEAVADRPPRTHVLRLLLRPHDLAEVRVAAEEPGRLLDRERVELLEPRDRDRLGARPLLVADDVVVDLALAEDEPRHPVAIRTGVVEHRLEAARRELVERRARLLQAQQALRR